MLHLEKVPFPRIFNFLPANLLLILLIFTLPFFACGDESSGGDGHARVKMVSAGVYHTLAIKEDGTLWAWGGNSYGRLGDGTLIDRSFPVGIGTESDWSAISAGDRHSVAIKDGSLYAWGENGNGQLGTGNTTSYSTPQPIAGADKDWTAVSARSFYTMAIKQDGSLYAWGANNNGQLGKGTVDSSNNSFNFSPVRIGADFWRAVAASRGNFTVAIKQDGSLHAWGINAYGQLGTGNTTQYSSPQPVAGVGADKDWTALSAGTYHTLAIKGDGSLYAWGRNNNGQLGDGTTTDRYTPVKIGTGWAMAETTTASVAIKTDGSLWAWGANGEGQLGDSTTINRFSPGQVGGDRDWKNVSSGYNYIMAIKRDGTLWAWGWNLYNQLGIGSLLNRRIPTRVIFDDSD